MKLFFASFILFLLSSCAGSNQKKNENQARDLASTHCSSCHQFPEPSLLNKKTWAYYVLPKMGRLLGFRHVEGVNYFEDDRLQPAMALHEWQQVVQYYVNNAPDSAPLTTRASIDTSKSMFRPMVPLFRVRPPLTSLVDIADNGDMWFADGQSQQLYRVRNRRLVDSLKTGTGTTQVTSLDGGHYILSMGVMYPSDARSGTLVHLDTGNRQVILDSLQRPVHASFGDINGDGQTDIVICEFGNTTGRLAWYEKHRDSGYVPHILKPLPGAVKSVIRDFNKDGKQDIMAMMAQSDEGMFLFFNEGNGRFREQRLVRFSPAHGSNYFELRDMNGDGNDDIITTNGDNGDYPPMLKNYHGIRIFLHEPSGLYKETVFLPVNGVCKAIALDFDRDGDIDIASIAYFADYKDHPFESFIFWENTGGLDFSPHSLRAALLGQWLVMDAGDADGDGDTDIVLGCAKMAMGVVPDSLARQWNENTPSILLLENLHN